MTVLGYDAADPPVALVAYWMATVDRIAPKVPRVAAIRADWEKFRNRGTEIAAKIPTITTTIMSSMNVKPFACFTILIFSVLLFFLLIRMIPAMVLKIYNYSQT